MQDFSDKTDDQINTWIANHERHRQTDTPLYRALLEERARRQSRGLKIENSLRLLTDAAKQQKFVTYGDVAKASGVPWNQARHAMNGPTGHLDRLLDVCHARNLPLLTSLCVNAKAVRTGELEGDSLAGFVRGAQRLGYSVHNHTEFLRQCQQACFEWARAPQSN